MGKISDRFRELLTHQVHERGIVVWYDPEKAYKGLVTNLSVGDATVLRYEDGFFRLRAELEQFLEFVSEDGWVKDDCGVAPKVVVYVPMARENTDHALIESESAGVIVEPGAPTVNRNTRLSGIAEQVFSEIAPEKAGHIARQTEEGLLTLDELDRMADEAGAVTAGALKLIFGHAAPVEVLLLFAASDAFDDALDQKKALGELVALARDEVDLDVGDNTSCESLRGALHQHLLLSELVMALPAAKRPGPLATFPLPEKKVQRDTIRHLVHQWRQRLDLQDAYRNAAETVEAQTGIAHLDLAGDSLSALETFRSIENRLLQQYEKSLVRGDSGSVETLARDRRDRFWSRSYPELGLRWSLVEVAAQLLQLSKTIQETLRKRKLSADDLIAAYTRHSEPWMLLDRHARHLESRFVRCEAIGDGSDAGLDTLMQQCRAQYVNTLTMFTEAYTGALERDGLMQGKEKDQSDVFAAFVAPPLKDGSKVAYFLVDALRYEMAVELCDGLADDFVVNSEPVLGQLPSITPVGMAALLPEAHEGLSLEPSGSRLKVSVKGVVVTDRAARLSWLAKQAGVSVATFKLGEVLRLTPKRKKELGTAQLIVVTSQEIDRHGEEGGDEEETRIYMDEVLEKLRRGLRSLAHAGIQEFVIAADHGFIFAEGLDEGLKMDAPGGKTADLHPRVWIGQGGTSAAGYFRMKASDLELGGPLELAFPRGLGLFKVPGGSSAYFHGGASLQERMIAVCRLTAKQTKRINVAAVNLVIDLAKPIITNRFFSVTLRLEADGLFTEVSKRIRFEVLSGKEEVGYAAMAAYGYEEGTREIQLEGGKPNSVTVMLSANQKVERVTLRAIDCESQLALATVSDVPVELML